MRQALLIGTYINKQLITIKTYSNNVFNVLFYSCLQKDHYVFIILTVVVGIFPTTQIVHLKYIVSFPTKLKNSSLENRKE